MPRRQLHEEFVEFFGRGDVCLDNFKALCTRRGWRTGRTGCFEKGCVPPNKGKKMPFNANSARTQFKKGQVPKNAKPLWHERVGKSGYVEWSVPERNPYTGHPRRYRQKHIWLWEQANGPIPKGHCLKSIDGNRQNTDPSNWQCIPRSLLPRLAGRWTLPYDPAPPELKPVIMAAAQLRHRAKVVAQRKRQP